MLPARWMGSTLLVSLPAHVDESNADQVRADLLAAADQAPRMLIADMSGTARCDWAGMEAIASASTRALAAGTELRLVVRDESVRRALHVNGLDRLMPIYRDMTTATYH